MKQSRRRRVLAALPLALVLGLSMVMADGGANHRSAQTLPVNLGTSGGNVNDRSNAFCCSGTLGALVTKGGNNYILSNNHVLGLSGSATVGQDVSQPGLIDVGCNVNGTETVGTFAEAPPLGGATNVDAALALTSDGQVNPSGAIIDVGVPSSTTADATLNMQVAKSGRTTGFTCGNVSSISTDVSVQYQAGCGKGKKFTVTYADQVVVSGSSFSAGGDSGSLIVSVAGVHPVALLYAGSSSTTIGNPIDDVTTALGISFVGPAGEQTIDTACPGGGGGGGGGNPGKGKGGGGSGIGQDRRVQNTPDMARLAKQQHAARLMEDEAAMGVGVGLDADGEAVVVIYVEEGRAHGFLPSSLNGVRTQIVRTDRFRAWGWNEKLMPEGACKAPR